jgi:hypothetical protein
MRSRTGRSRILNLRANPREEPRLPTRSLNRSATRLPTFERLATTTTAKEKRKRLTKGRGLPLPYRVTTTPLHLRLGAPGELPGGLR